MGKYYIDFELNEKNRITLKLYISAYTYIELNHNKVDFYKFLSQLGRIVTKGEI